MQTSILIIGKQGSELTAYLNQILAKLPESSYADGNKAVRITDKLKVIFYENVDFSLYKEIMSDNLIDGEFIKIVTTSLTMNKVISIRNKLGFKCYHINDNGVCLLLDEFIKTYTPDFPKKMPLITMNGFNSSLHSKNREKDEEINDADLHKIEEFIYKYFSQSEKMNLQCSSYGLKHIIERCLKTYVSNGQCIKAFINCGFKVKRFGLNAAFNVSKKDVKSVEAKCKMEEKELQDFINRANNKKY